MRNTAIIALCAAALLGCGETTTKAPEAAKGLVIGKAATLPATPGDPAWQGVAPATVPLLPQDVTEPRLTDGVKEVEVRALGDGTSVAWRLSWADPTQDDGLGVTRFADGCAVQLPGAGGPDVPDSMMGQPGRPVRITLWKAIWQAIAGGKEQTIARLYPNALIDHYPHGDHVAAAVSGNSMATLPGGRVTQDLVAEGYGSLSPAPEQTSKGAGAWADGKWSVVIVTAAPPSPRSYAAFAVWDGAGRQTGARKMRSDWVGTTAEGGAP